jgi:arylsulfatase A-like enzyme
VHDALARRGLLDGAWLVYTSDHGEELGDHHRYFQHGNSIYSSALRIPLIVARDGHGSDGGRRVGGLAQILDLFPTLLEAAGVDVPADTEGVSLAAALDGGGTGRPLAFAEWEDLIYAVTDGAWSYVHNPKGAWPRKPPYHAVAGTGFPIGCFELYDVAADPLEQIDVFARRPDQAGRLRDALASFLSDPRHRDAMATERATDEGLDALGYLGTTTERDVLFVPCLGLPAPKEGR